MRGRCGRKAAARWALLSLVLCTPAASPLAAQDPGAPWRLSYFPYFTVSPNDGLMGVARAIWFRQAPWGERVTLRKSFAVEAGYSTKDAWLARATWDDPTLADGWRLKAHAEAGVEPRFGPLDDGTDGWRRSQQFAWADVTRRLAGPLSLAVRPAVRHQRIAFASGDVASPLAETDLSVRGALVVDLRDREYETNRGILAEAGAITGTGGRGRGYSAPYGQIRGWAHPIAPLRVTARAVWRGTVGSGALAPAYEFPAWEGDFTVVGGPRSQRGLPIGAESADGVVLAGLEARLDILNVGELGAVTLVGFVDGSKLEFADDTHLAASRIHPSLAAVRPTGVGDWTWAPGGGIAIRILRAAILNISAARADGRTQWYVGSGWAW